MKKRYFLIILLLILTLAIAYFYSSNEPSFPEKILDYELISIPYYSTNSFFDNPQCVEFEGNKVCGKTARLEYYSKKENVSIHFIPGVATYGDWKKYLNEQRISGTEVSPGVYLGEEKWELHWRSKKYPIIVVQEYDHKTPSSDEISLNNPVVQYFLSEYLPIK